MPTASFAPTSETTAGLLRSAVHRHHALSPRGLSERLFTAAFQRLVYAQIWEDPVVDMKALQIGSNDHVVCIASGGCNVMSYLDAGPASIAAVDLNGAHVALLRLKLEAARRLPGHAEFHRFFAHAASRDNVAAYDRWIAPHLDAQSRRYWEGRDWRGRRRIGMFARGFYRHGLLGNFIGAAHGLARLAGGRPRNLLAARTLEAQREIFETSIAPALRSRLTRAIVSSPVALFGLGIPPVQYSALSENGARPMIDVLEERLRRLLCDFPLCENYFAWQALQRGYDSSPEAPVPPYLEREAYGRLRAGVDRVSVQQIPLTAWLARRPDWSATCYGLLDAQDWMSAAEMAALWREITRTARPGARVIFRTAGVADILPGKVPADLLSRWTRNDAVSAELTRQDRSAIYGGFHLHTRK